MGNFPVACSVGLGLAVRTAEILDNFDDRHRAHSLIPHHSGAASEGAAQLSPSNSIGSYWASDLARELGFYINDPIPGIDVLHVSGANGAGNGIITAPSENELAYSAPGGSIGPRKTFSNGDILMLESGGEPEKWVMVERTSANDLEGSQTVLCQEIYNGVFGMTNFDEVATEKLRLVVYRNESYFTVKNLRFWIDPLVRSAEQPTDVAQLGAGGAGSIQTSGSFAGWPQSGWANIYLPPATIAYREIVYYESRTDTVLTVSAPGRGELGTSASAGQNTEFVLPVAGRRIGYERPVAGQFTVLSDENDIGSLGAITWKTGIFRTQEDLDVGSVEPGSMIGLWMRGTTLANIKAEARVRTSIAYSYTAE